MQYAFVFLVVALVCLLEAALIDGWGWLLLWPALCYLGVALAYGGCGPGLLGKRADGSLAPLAMLFFLPFLLPTWGVWHLQRLLSNEPACQEITPGLWLGRRLLPGEVPPQITLIVDLTAEFREPAGVIAEHAYLALPTLDGHVPRTESLRRGIEQVAGHSGPVLIHCASGHGRSAMVLAGVLLARGLACDVADAERRMQAIRPRVRLSTAQRRRVQAFARSLASC